MVQGAAPALPGPDNGGARIPARPRDHPRAQGNKPLEFRINRRHRAVLYASDSAFLDAVLAEERGWRELSVPAMSLIVFRHEVLMEFSRESLEFIAQAKRGKAP